MATQKGVNRTLADTAGPISPIPRGMQNGTVHGMFDMMEATADAAGEIYQMGGLLPAGAVMIGIFLSCEDLTADGGTLSIGDTADPNRYANALDVGTAALSGPNVMIVPDSTTATTTGMGYVIGTATGDNQIEILTATGAIDSTIAITVLYLI